jgi:hypothetical protein
MALIHNAATASKNLAMTWPEELVPADIMSRMLIPITEDELYYKIKLANEEVGLSQVEKYRCFQHGFFEFESAAARATKRGPPRGRDILFDKQHRKKHPSCMVPWFPGEVLTRPMKNEDQAIVSDSQEDSTSELITIPADPEVDPNEEIFEPLKSEGSTKICIDINLPFDVNPLLEPREVSSDESLTQSTADEETTQERIRTGGILNK